MFCTSLDGDFRKSCYCWKDPKMLWNRSGYSLVFLVLCRIMMEQWNSILAMYHYVSYLLIQMIRSLGHLVLLPPHVKESPPSSTITRFTNPCPGGWVNSVVICTRRSQEDPLAKSSAVFSITHWPERPKSWGDG